MLSAMTSRETSEYRMPWWPIMMPSVAVGQPKTCGTAPPVRTPSIALCASRSRWALHGVMSECRFATPTIGLSKSSSRKPTARSMARAGARAAPPVVVRLLRFGSTMTVPEEGEDWRFFYLWDILGQVWDISSKHLFRVFHFVPIGDRRAQHHPCHMVCMRVWKSQSQHMPFLARRTMNSHMAGDAPQICVVGSANVDLTFRTPRLPKPGETVAGRELIVGFGGKGANQAVAAARLGASVSFVARVGDDPYGRDYVQRLATETLDRTYVRPTAGQPTGTAAILVDDDAQNCIVVAPGANARLTPADVWDASAVIGGANVLLCQLEVPRETTLAAFRIASLAGVRTVLNPAPAAKLPMNLLRLTDMMVLNETELELLTGRDEVESGAADLRRLGPGTVVVTLGERGARLHDDGGTTTVGAFPVTAVDTTGAGDAFTAA